MTKGNVEFWYSVLFEYCFISFILFAGYGTYSVLVTFSFIPGLFSLAVAGCMLTLIVMIVRDCSTKRP